MKDSQSVPIEAVRSFWNANPVSAKNIPYPLGSPEFFDFYDKKREAKESLAFSYALHEYKNFVGQNVLDVGCGNGYVLSNYAKEGANVFGVDLTATALFLSRRRFELAGFSGKFYQASAEELPFDKASFDCVCSMGVLHHTPNTEKAIKEIFRVLRPGGRLIIMVYHRNSIAYRFTFPLISLLKQKPIQQLVNEVDGAGNPRGDVYSRPELKKLLHKFEQIEMFVDSLRGAMILPKVGHLIPQNLLQPFEKKWGWFLYAKAAKPAAQPK